MGKNIYNYDKEVEQADTTDLIKKCQYSSTTFVDTCNIAGGYIAITKFNGCDNLHVTSTTKVENKYLYDRWVNTIIFALLYYRL